MQQREQEEVGPVERVVSRASRGLMLVGGGSREFGSMEGEGSFFKNFHLVSDGEVGGGWQCFFKCPDAYEKVECGKEPRWNSSSGLLR